jgi:hypothetical protein
MNQDDEENFLDSPLFHDRDDDNVSQSDDFQNQDQGNSSPDKDEQHEQKINGQLESLQQKVEELTKELIGERRSHEETKIHKQLNDDLYDQKLQRNEQIINELRDKLASNAATTIDSSSVRAEMTQYCSKYGIAVDITASDNDLIINVLRSSSRLLEETKTLSRKASIKSPRSTLTSPRNSTFTPLNVSPILVNEFSKFCLKTSVFVDNLNTDASSFNEEKCCAILQKASKMIVDNATKVKNLEAELKMSLNASEDIRALKTKLIQLVERIRLEKEHKVKAENDTLAMKRKVEMLSDHIEKLMTHLKHEATSKLRIADQLRTSERDFLNMKDTCEAVQKKSTAKDRLILELREGSKILEDQLRLMDEKYLELRSKLDWAREIGAAKLRKAEKKASELRVKYAMATNSNAILDNFTLPSIYGHSGMMSDPGMTNASMLSNRGPSTMSIVTTNSRLSSGRNPRKNQGHDGSRTVASGSIYDEPKEPSMEHVLEKLRLQENKKREWTEEKMRKLVESR